MFDNEKLVDPNVYYVDRDKDYVPEDRHPFFTAPTVFDKQSAINHFYGVIGIFLFVAAIVIGLSFI